MLKINRTDADIERIAECLLNHAECEDITDTYLVAIRDMPERWLRAIWPNCTDEDIIREFKDAFYCMQTYEVSPINPEDDPYFLYAEYLRNSWLTKRVDIMLREERIPEDEENEIYEMLEVINNRKRRTYEEVYKK